MPLPIQIRSKFITHLKFLMVIATMGMIATVIIWPLTNPVGKALQVTFNSAVKDGDPQSTMSKPSFHGIDDKNQPFNITAEQAKQLDADTVEMKKISGDIFLSDGKWVYVSAESGQVKVSTKIVDLKGSVSIISDNTYELKTESAQINLNTSVASGNQGVTLNGLSGVLTAKTFEFDKNSYKFTFTGDVELTIYRNKP